MIETAAVEIIENCNNIQTSNICPYNNDEINSLHNLGLELNTAADTLSPIINTNIKDKLQQWVLAYNV